MPLAYYGVALPDKHNWLETPEGYLIFKNAVIGRTGFQTYKGSELDENELMEQGISVGYNDDVQLFRDPLEVFSDRTIASFIGKSVTEGHPSELLSLENVKDHEQGQVINVRRGNDALDSGDYPLLADLIVKSQPLIEKIKAGLRELSCGYNYHVLKDGDILKQVDIIGNHVAIVENARAGREAVIVDSTPVIHLERWNPLNILDRVLNSNRKSKLATWAKDAKPEEVADIIDSLTTELESRPGLVTKIRVRQPARDATVKDIAKDNATDAASDRKRHHDALDRMLDGCEEKEAAKDADVEELRKMFSARHGKDEAADGEDEAADEEGEDAEDAENEEKEEEKGEDEAGALTIEPADRPKPSGPGADSIQAAQKQGAVTVLRLLKPLIAQSGDKKLIAAYDTAARAVQGKSHGKTSEGYGKFADASVRRGKAAQDSAEQNANKKIAETIGNYEKLYADRFSTKR